MTNYKAFLESKRINFNAAGFTLPAWALHHSMFDWQRAIVRWALAKGRCAIFAGCGLGKTRMQLEWAHQVEAKTGLPVLILAPLAVAPQTVFEGLSIDVEVNHVREQSQVKPGLNIANYDILDKLDPTAFGGIVLDESSILKSLNGKTRKKLTASFAHTPYRLCCTATPAPNDHVELGNHSEFLGILPQQSMLSRWFVNDGFEAGAWRLKKHAVKDFWLWVSSWAVCLSKPSDLGYSDEGFELPELRQEKIIVEREGSIFEGGKFLNAAAPSATDLHKELRKTLRERVAATADLVRDYGGTWVLWCNSNEESAALVKSIPGAVEIIGSYTPERKEQILTDFADGKTKVLISKSSITGFGLNWQFCHQTAFVGVSYSFERVYQSIRRFWRFGQLRPVDVFYILSPVEARICAAVERKAEQHAAMEREMVADVHSIDNLNNYGVETLMDYEAREAHGKGWTLKQGDCVERTREIPDASVHFSIFSPPFSSLFVYSDNYRDMGNCGDDQTFFEHFQFLIPELFRVTVPGRLCAVHCSQLPLHKGKDGRIGIKDFRGDLIRAFDAHGWTYHSEVCIWKDPVVEMQRTKALGLLHKQLCKDSSQVRQGMPDYLLVFRREPREGETLAPVKRPEGLSAADYIGEDDQARTSIDVWQRYASPVWFDIKQGDVLNRLVAKGDKDERHICPTQHQVISRAIHLWTLPGETVFTPFAGIGTEVYNAVKLGRRGVGVELKPEYFDTAVENMKSLERGRQYSIFDLTKEAAA